MGSPSSHDARTLVRRSKKRGWGGILPPLFFLLYAFPDSIWTVVFIWTVFYYYTWCDAADFNSSFRIIIHHFCWPFFLGFSHDSGGFANSCVTPYHFYYIAFSLTIFRESARAFNTGYFLHYYIYFVILWHLINYNRFCYRFCYFLYLQLHVLKRDQFLCSPL